MSHVWRVHTFQITVKVGDSSIHLLVDTAVNPPMIYSAVLIDGGRTTKSLLSIVEIIGVINEPSRYQFADNRFFENPGLTTKSLRFDSIVITHWDVDHYEGVIKLLEEGFKSMPTNPARNFFCKYDNSAVVNVASGWTINQAVTTPAVVEALLTPAVNSICRTTIYAPYSVCVNTTNGLPAGFSGPFLGTSANNKTFLMRGIYNQNVANQTFATMIKLQSMLVHKINSRNFF
jgi:hypothetical protein